MSVLLVLVHRIREVLRRHVAHQRLLVVAADPVLATYGDINLLCWSHGLVEERRGRVLMLLETTPAVPSATWRWIATHDATALARLIDERGVVAAAREVMLDPESGGGWPHVALAV